jgi:hypothetical protein
VDGDKLSLRAGQITIEYILIMVIMLAVLGSVTLPIVNNMTDVTRDTSRVVSLAAAQRRIINTAEEVSMSSCGSFKVVGIYMTPEVLAAPNVLWNKTHVWGNFSNASGNSFNLTRLEYPSYIKIEGGTCPAGCMPISNNTFFIRVLKDCTGTGTTPVCPLPDGDGNEWSGVGVGVC